MKRSMTSRIAGRLKQRRDPHAPRLAILQPSAGTEQDRMPPIFVVGCQRSGTSLVRRILDSHSRIACPPESRFVLPMIRVLEEPQSLQGLESMGYDRTAVKQALARFISSFFERYADTAGKARWADKTPHYVDCLPELLDLFGGSAQFLLVVRHGMDTAYSLADPHRHYPAIDDEVEAAGGDVPVGAARFWAKQNRKIEDFRKRHLDACFRVFYEDLTTSPGSVLEPMFEFLGELWEPEVIDYSRVEHHSGIEDPDVRRRSRIEPNSGKYRSWPSATQDAVRQACTPMLSELGYK